MEEQRGQALDEGNKTANKKTEEERRRMYFHLPVVNGDLYD